MTGSVVSQRAEDAWRLLNETMAAHQVSIAAVRSIHPTLRLGRVADREEMQHHATLVRLMSITEGFVAERLTGVLDQWGSGSRAELQETWDSAVLSALTSWESMKEAYKTWLKVGPAAVDWNPVSGFVEARNAVAHGLGTLTRQQGRNQKARDRTVSRLAHAKIKLTAADAVPLDDDILQRAVEGCRAFIESLDLAVTAEGHP